MELRLIQSFERVLASFFSLELNDTAAFTAALFIHKYVDSDNISCLAHVVLQILP